VFPGRLSVSRAFGDIEAKKEKYGGKDGVVIAIPEIKLININYEKDDFIILGCDGIFDYLSTK
jgi:serine/threonine protein phosphatase PrpC